MGVGVEVLGRVFGGFLWGWAVWLIGVGPVVRGLIGVLGLGFFI